MEKRKVFKISIIDKEISRTEFDRNTFYTSDSELSLVFKLIEKGYTYDHGEILLYNENDKSFVTRQVTKKENDFVYELESDIIPHYGKWKAQLQLIKDGDVYTSKPFDFVIENDLSNLAPQPTLTDINNWATLKQSANELIDEMKDMIVDVEQAESERTSNENYRKKAELNRVNNEQSRKNSELTRENQENERQQAESKRENNEKQRRSAEFERVENENTRQTAEIERQSIFETNETERQKTFETAEQERQSAELIRIENENQRNLTSVDEFIKLQDAIGGRNYATENHSLYNIDGIYGYRKIADIGESVTIKVIDRNPDVTLPSSTTFGLTRNGSNGDGGVDWIRGLYREITSTDNLFFSFYPKRDEVLKAIMERYYVKVEKSPISTPYTKAPEDYEVVSKEDYYNHIKMMNEFKDNQYNQLKQAVIALGGTI